MRKKKIADLASYTENNFDGLHGSRSLKDKVGAKMDTNPSTRG
jgi:hypothetical protein